MICRAKSLLTHEFVEGGFIQGKHAWIVQIKEDGSFSHILVDPNTVGKCTGKIARDGVKIFEGDIVKAKVIQNQWSKVREYTEIYVVAYHPQYCYFYLKRDGNNLLFDWNWSYGVFINEVIGNIHDNPELLQEARHDDK